MKTLKPLLTLIFIVVRLQHIQAEYTDDQKAMAAVALMSKYVKKLQSNIESLNKKLDAAISKPAKNLADIRTAIKEFNSTIFSATLVSMVPSYDEIITKDDIVKEGLDYKE